MKLKLLCRGIWAIYVVCNERGDDAIGSLTASEDEEAQLAAFFERVAAEGVDMLPDNRNHAINADPKIIQWTVGKYRIAYFFDGVKCIIIAAAYPKRGGKTGKASKRDKKLAIRIYNLYHQQKKIRGLAFEENDD